MHIRIHCDYPGGNIKIKDISEHIIKLEQDIRDTTEWWFYWGFCTENAGGQEITFEFTNGEVVGPFGPSVSRDGVNWEWAGKECFLNHQSFRYKFDEQDNEVYFCFSIPYQLADLERFIEKNKVHPLFSRDVLTSSEQGRPIPLLLIGNRNAERHILLTCRHHACESSASYVLEGLMEFLLNQRNDSLLRDYLFSVIPFVDIDGVENGDQGKSRNPHDHNRDYSQYPIYRSAGAIMEYIKDKNIAFAIDFHSPYKWGYINDYPFMVKQLPPMKAELEKLGEILAQVTRRRTGSNGIIFHPEKCVEANEDWNDMSEPSLSNYLRDNNAKISFSFEIPYFGLESTPYTQQNTRAFGADIARALELYSDFLCRSSSDMF